MRADSFAVVALLFGTEIFVVGTPLTFTSTLLGYLAAPATLVVLTIAVAVASVFGALTDARSRTPYW